MRRIVATFLGAAAVFVLTPTIQAAVIGYDEAVSGDLSGGLPFDYLGLVDIGDNTIAGSTFALADPAFSIDIDSFSFDVSADLRVTQIIFAWELTATGRVGVAVTSFELQQDSDGLEFITIDLLSSTPPFTEVVAASGEESLFSSSLPLAAGSYHLANSLFGIGGGGADPRSWTINYLWTISAERVDSVPEPSVSLLLGAGLAICGVRRRRRLGRIMGRSRRPLGRCVGGAPRTSRGMAHHVRMTDSGHVTGSGSPGKGQHPNPIDGGMGQG